MKKRFLVIAISALAAMLPLTSRADTVYYLTASNSGLGLPTIAAPGYGQVTLHQDGSNVDVTVSLDTVPDIDFINSGLLGFAWNLDTSPTGVTVTSSGFSYDNPGGGKNDGGGTFGFSITCSACSNGGSNPQEGPLAFTVDGVSVSDFMQTSTGANGGKYFAADVIDKSVSGGPTGLIWNTGGPTTPTPEPGSLLLFGSGLTGLAAFLRKHKLAK